MPLSSVLAIPASQAVEQLRLDENGITSEGAVAMAGALAQGALPRLAAPADASHLAERKLEPVRLRLAEAVQAKGSLDLRSGGRAVFEAVVEGWSRACRVSRPRSPDRLLPARGVAVPRHLAHQRAGCGVALLEVAGALRAGDASLPPVARAIHQYWRGSGARERARRAFCSIRATAAA